MTVGWGIFSLMPVIIGGFSLQTLLVTSARLMIWLVGMFEISIYFRYSPHRCRKERKNRITTYRDSARLFLFLGGAFLLAAAEFTRPGGNIQHESHVFVTFTGVFFFLLGLLSYGLLRRAWPSAQDPSRIESRFVRSSPFGDVYNLGLQLLDRETDPVERRKLASALEKLKKGSRLK
jgi:hypothetical protein